MILAGDLRKGVTFVYDGNIYVVVDFLHVKPGKGESKQMEYLYSDGELYYFMDPESYEQVPLNKSQVEDALMFMKENMQATIKFYKGEAFSVEPPNFVELLITHCEPGVAGNTATNASKPATLETGYELQVPMFINEGDVIRVETRTGEYMERAK